MQARLTPASVTGRVVVRSFRIKAQELQQHQHIQQECYCHIVGTDTRLDQWIPTTAFKRWVSAPSQQASSGISTSPAQASTSLASTSGAPAVKQIQIIIPGGLDGVPDSPGQAGAGRLKRKRDSASVSDICLAHREVHRPDTRRFSRASRPPRKPMQVPRRQPCTLATSRWSPSVHTSELQLGVPIRKFANARLTLALSSA